MQNIESESVVDEEDEYDLQKASSGFPSFAVPATARPKSKFVYYGF